MEVLWTNYCEDGNYPHNGKDLDLERLKLLNPKHKTFISNASAKKYANKHKVSVDKALKVLEEENNKQPIYLDDKRIEYLDDLNKKCHESVKDYCVKNYIFYTDFEHQSSYYDCVPLVIDNNGNAWAMTYSLRAWSGLMADVWNKILNTDKYDYLSFYCSNEPSSEIISFLKDRNLWAKTPPVHMN